MLRIRLFAALLCGLMLATAHAYVPPASPAADSGITPPGNSWKPRDNSEDAWVRHTMNFVDAWNRDDIAAARHHASEALAIALAIYGSEHVNTADSFNKMGIALEASGALEQARINYEKALDILTSVLGEQHQDVGTALNNLANLHSLQNHNQQAEALHLRALRIRDRDEGHNPAGVAQSAYNLALLYDKIERHQDAERYYRQAIRMWETAEGGEGGPLTVRPLTHLASLYARTGNLHGAEELQLRTLHIRNRVLGPGSLEAAESLFNLGTLCSRQEKYDEAEPYFREALEIMRVQLSPGDPQLAVTMYSLANTYHIQAKTEEAQQGAAPEHSHRLPDTAPQAMATENSQGQQHIAALYRKAAPLYRHALQIFTAAYGKDHPSVVTVREELSMLMESIER